MSVTAHLLGISARGINQIVKRSEPQVYVVVSVMQIYLFVVVATPYLMPGFFFCFSAPSLIPARLQTKFETASASVPGMSGSIPH